MPLQKKNTSKFITTTLDEQLVYTMERSQLFSCEKLDNPLFSQIPVD